MRSVDKIVDRARTLAARVREWFADSRPRRHDSAFRLEGLLRHRRGMQAFCFFTVALLVVSAIDSYVADPELFLVLLRIRVAGAAVSILILALLSRRDGVRWARWLTLAFVVTAAWMLHALAMETGGQASLQYDRINLLILGLAVFATWSAGWATLACALIVGVYLVGTAAADGLDANHFFVQNLSRMVAAVVVTVGATAIREHRRWQAFLAQRRLRETDAQRRESEQRYQLLVETAGSAIIVLAPDCRIVDFNREAEMLYGRARAEVLGRNYAQLFVPARLKADYERLVASVLAGKPVRAIESPVRARSGELRMVLWNITRVDAADATALGIIGVGQDITERERAVDEVERLNRELEQRVQARTSELRASEERFRTIFDSAPIGILTADGDGRVRHDNRALQSMLGLSLAELQETTLHELTAAADRMRSRNAFTQMCQHPGTELLIDKRYVNRSGAMVWVHEASAVVRDEHGEFDYALTMVEDVTERQHAEARARQHQEHLAHVLRVSTMGEMAAELAHELNQPLGAIVNFANGTLVRLRARGIDAEIEQAVAQIAGEGLRAGEIIRRIRDFVRQGDSRREASDINELVRQAAHLINSDARHSGIPVRLMLDPALPLISVDRIQMEQLIVNLLRNAIDAIVSAAHGNDEVRVQTNASAESVQVSVRDTGIGLPAGGATRIFDAFYTTKRGGLGMGLSISRSIIEAHGGRLWATANRDRGTTFTFSLPRAARKGVEAA